MPASHNRFRRPQPELSGVPDIVQRPAVGVRPLGVGDALPSQVGAHALDGDAAIAGCLKRHSPIDRNALGAPFADGAWRDAKVTGDTACAAQVIDPVLSHADSLRHYRMPDQGIASSVPDRQRAAMPKRERETTDPIGRKLLAVLREQGHPDDLKHLADAFGIQVQSTYDWIRHGRIAKERYARLVEWSGRDLHWWFDIPASITTDAALAPAPAVSTRAALLARYFDGIPDQPGRDVAFAKCLLAIGRLLPDGWIPPDTSPPPAATMPAQPPANKSTA